MEYAYNVKIQIKYFNQNRIQNLTHKHKKSGVNIKKGKTYLVFQHF